MVSCQMCFQWIPHKKELRCNGCGRYLCESCYINPPETKSKTPGLCELCYNISIDAEVKCSICHTMVEAAELKTCPDCHISVCRNCIKGTIHPDFVDWDFLCETCWRIYYG